MSEDQTVLLEIRDGMAFITLNRPAQLNAIDMAVAAGLLAAATRCAADTSIHSVILTASGDRAFCAGGDIPSFTTHFDDIASFAVRLTDCLHLALSRLARLEAPVIAAINGVVAGAGLGLVGIADLVIAAEHATFKCAYTNIGITPDAGTTYHLTRLLGPRRAAELMLTNRVLTAKEALDWGLINSVVPQGELWEASTVLAKKLREGPALAQAGIKELLRASLDDQLETHLQREARSIGRLMLTSDGREGFRAFVEKRRPRFNQHEDRRDG